VGDLGNIVLSLTQDSIGSMTDGVIQLKGDHSIIGRSVGINLCVITFQIVLHAGTDDLGKGNASDSLTTGHAG